MPGLGEFAWIETKKASAMIIPPWIYAAAGGVALLGAFGAGWQVRAWKCEAALTAGLEAQQKAFDAQLATQQQESTDYEAQRSASGEATHTREVQIRTEFRDRTIAGDCAVPDGARRVLDYAVQAANVSASGKSGGAVPEPTGAAEPAH